MPKDLELLLKQVVHVGAKPLSLDKIQVGVEHFVKSREIAVGSHASSLLRRKEDHRTRTGAEPNEVRQGVLLSDLLTLRILDREVRAQHPRP